MQSQENVSQFTHKEMVFHLFSAIKYFKNYSHIEIKDKQKNFLGMKYDKLKMTKLHMQTNNIAPCMSHYQL